MRIAAILIAFALSAFAQRHKLEDFDTEKPEGKLLQQAMQEDDAAKKIALLERFAGEYPKLELTAAVLEQLQGLYVKSNDPDKILSAGERLLALDPDDPEAALQNLKAAEAKKDVAAVKKWSILTATNAQKVMNAPKPADAEQADTWKANADYAKQVDTYSEYALFRAAAESRDPKLTIDLGETLDKGHPKGEYVSRARDLVFVAYRQTGANDKALALAERVLAIEQTNEDMLLVVADNYLQNKKEPEKVHTYSAKVVELMTAKPKPEGVADAEWTARKSLVVGLAHYMNGKLYFNENRFPPADQSLRSALPLVESNAALKPEVLFLLGQTNYKLDKAQDAANYFRACAAIKSNFQVQAAKNLAVIQKQYTGIK